MRIDMDLLLTTPLYIPQKLSRDAIRALGTQLTGKVLDIGCGRKPYKKFVAHCEYTGMDQCESLKPDVVGSILNIPFKDESFDSVMCTAVLEHISEPENGVKEMARVLRKGGMAYISVPMTWYMHYEPNDYFRYTRYGMAHILEKNGFDILETVKSGGFFSYALGRALEIAYNVLFMMLCFLPGKLRERMPLFLIAPVSLVCMGISVVLDKRMKKDAFAWIFLARKK